MHVVRYRKGNRDKYLIKDDKLSVFSSYKAAYLAAINEGIAYPSIINLNADLDVCLIMDQ